ncbi:MAG: 2Fe-2S iron-sulfur cluster-binding protein [Candidatus Heimdallarchaeota archaeon]
MKKIITLQIDDKEVKAEEGITVLEAAKQAGVEIPTLCYLEGLEPYGACRICSVEIEKRGRTRVAAACCYPVEEGLKVRTRSPKIDKIRKTIIELAAITAGEDVAGKMRALTSEYNADLSRFKSKVSVEPTMCILCGICVRRCIEANWDSAIGFAGRGIYRRVVRFPEKAGICLICNYCSVVCPTGRIPSTGPDPPFPFIDDVLAGRK